MIILSFYPKDELRVQFNLEMYKQVTKFHLGEIIESLQKIFKIQLKKSMILSQKTWIKLQLVVLNDYYYWRHSQIEEKWSFI
jgi:hypothetical protein